MYRHVVRGYLLNLDIDMTGLGRGEPCSDSAGFEDFLDLWLAVKNCWRAQLATMRSRKTIYNTYLWACVEALLFEMCSHALVCILHLKP